MNKKKILKKILAGCALAIMMFSGCATLIFSLMAM